MKGKKRDKKIALGGLKEVKGNIYLLKMEENFIGLTAAGKESEKKSLKIKKIRFITKIQTLKETECNGILCAGEGKTPLIS